jgi:MFS superfamily sulfate permease-like transporter
MTSQTSSSKTASPIHFGSTSAQTRFATFMGLALTALVALAFAELAHSTPAATHASDCTSAGVTGRC